MIRLYGFARSTNVERVSLALAHKGLEVEEVPVDPDDRSEVRRISGQGRVPVIVDGETVVRDSMQIVAYLEDRYPDPPLYPADRARRAEMHLFIDWFNRVWKRAPNQIEAELGSKEPDHDRVERMGRSMTHGLDLFEDLLAGRDYLMGEFSAADCCAFPFLAFGLLGTRGSTYLFHRILVDWLPVGEDHPGLAAWIHRMDERPRAAHWPAAAAGR